MDYSERAQIDSFLERITTRLDKIIGLLEQMNKKLVNLNQTTTQEEQKMSTIAQSGITMMEWMAKMNKDKEDLMKELRKEKEK